MFSFLLFILLPFIALWLFGFRVWKFVIFLAVIHFVAILAVTVGGIMEFITIGNGNMRAFDIMISEEGSLVTGQWIDQQDQLWAFFLYPYVIFITLWQLYLYYLFSGYASLWFIIPNIGVWLLGLPVILSFLGGSSSGSSNQGSPAQEPSSKKFYDPDFPERTFPGERVLSDDLTKKPQNMV